jgi:hypothetical protein
VKRSKGIRDSITGITLLIVSMLILVGPIPFVGQTFAWVILWSCFFGWMSVWGAYSLGQGIGRIIECSRLRHDQTPQLEVLPANTTSNLLGPVEEQRPVGRRVPGYDRSIVPSVTETTTRHLDSQAE